MFLQHSIDFARHQQHGEAAVFIPFIARNNQVLLHQLPFALPPSGVPLPSTCPPLYTCSEAPITYNDDESVPGPAQHFSHSKNKDCSASLKRKKTCPTCNGSDHCRSTSKYCTGRQGVSRLALYSNVLPSGELLMYICFVCVDINCFSL
jgi:hypothetical protein